MRLHSLFLLKLLPLVSMKHFFAIILSLVGMSLFLVAPAQAVSGQLQEQIQSGLADSAKDTFDTTGDGTNDGEIALSIVFEQALQIAIGVLGLAAVVLIVYAGYLWMAAGGNSGQIDTAKKIIARVVIGMIVVALAYGIIAFALSAFAPSGPAENPNASSAGESN